MQGGAEGRFVESKVNYLREIPLFRLLLLKERMETIMPVDPKMTSGRRKGISTPKCRLNTRSWLQGETDVRKTNSVTYRIAN